MMNRNKNSENSELSALDVGLRAGWAAAEWDCAMQHDPEHGAIAQKIHDLAGCDLLISGLALADAHDEGAAGRAAADRAVEILRGEGAA